MKKEQQELQLVNSNQAQRLKKLGFDWNTYYCYHSIETYRVFTYNDLGIFGVDKENKNNLPFIDFNNAIDWYDNVKIYSAPTVAFALKWIREVRSITAYVSSVVPKRWKYYIWDNDEWKQYLGNYFDTYEDAESALLDELLNILEKEL